uniref:Threonine synthase n=1 Tax=Candidatus Methanophagaceae archaeon ANME-1 ERB6 TaxID=2759912 RepID=A0A7G9YZE1_9EURY|nr:threonine synthase [Methanosarcinales archaeon ANME-1 ERB6]QNO53375.1 threonine synthase [Methanosarcinales archaeon ANME-1 ERB6]
MGEEYKVECIKCGAQFSKEDVVYTCRKCGGLLNIKYDYSEIDADRIVKARGEGVWKYRVLLPFAEETKPVTINEGNTPLYRCDRLAKSSGVDDLWVKHEGLNPSGSFKDRGMTVGVTKAVELGVKGVACASTGNTSASLAIFAAKAGIPCYVMLPKGKVALGKVAQAMMHGAKVFSLRGNFDDALRIVRVLCEEEKLYLLNSVNPYRLEGQKTIAFEVAEKLGWKALDRVILPVGNAGNLSAIFKGFLELKTLGITDSIPKMTGIQAAGARPIVNAFEDGKEEITPEDKPETIASAIRIGNPVNAAKALFAIRDSGGVAESVTDDEITESQLELARLEGIGVEPASAASIAGLKKLVALGEIDRDEKIVCITTGHLLKDPERVIKICEAPKEVDADVDVVRKMMKGHSLKK